MRQRMIVTLPLDEQGTCRIWAESRRTIKSWWGSREHSTCTQQRQQMYGSYTREHVFKKQKDDDCSCWSVVCVRQKKVQHPSQRNRHTCLLLVVRHLAWTALLKSLRTQKSSVEGYAEHFNLKKQGIRFSSIRAPSQYVKCANFTSSYTRRSIKETPKRLGGLFILLTMDKYSDLGFCFVFVF